MAKVRPILVAIAVVALAGSSVLWGCNSATRYQVQTYQPGTYVVTQPPQVVYTQPTPVVVQRPPTVYVRQPTVYVRQPTVYVRQPTVYVRPQTPVMNPARVYVAPLQYSVANPWPARHCMPGTSRTCGETYCGYGGSQFCNADGMSWGPCLEERGWVE